MEITLKIDISERLQEIAEHFAEIAAEYVGKMGDCEPATERVPCGTVDVKTCETPYENPPQDAQKQEAVDNTAVEQNAVPEQTSCESEPVPEAQPEQEPEMPKAKKSRAKKSREESSAQPEPVETPQEIAENASVSAETPEPVADTPEPQSDAQEQASCDSEPKADDDPYCGMTLLGAVQSLLDEIGQKGIELADVNARVRKECTARSLPFNSAACLMKAVGYKEARRIALGE